MLKTESSTSRCRHPACAADGAADLVLGNGAGYAADAGQNEFQAVAVRGGQIVYRGTDRGAGKWIGPSTQVIDLRGKTMLPGFHDAHLHPLMGAAGMLECKLTGLSDPADYLARVRRWSEQHPDDQTIRGSGWLYSSFEARGPNKADLDRVVPDRPVLLKAIDGHSAWVNSCALELAGITRATTDPPGGRIERDPATGEATGTLREWSAMQLVEARFPKWGEDKLARAFQSFLKAAVRAGLTAVHDAMASADYLSAYLAAEKQGALTLRVSASLLCEPENGVSSIADLSALRRDYQTAYISARSAKLFVDGVIEGHTAFLLAPYADRPGFTGEPLWRREDFGRTVAALDREGFQVHVHAVGDGAVRMALDGFEYAVKENGGRDSRHQIAHLDLIAAQDVPRFRSLGVIANFQPLWFPGDAASAALDEQLLGAQRARGLYPLPGVLAAHGAVTCGSDWPVGAERISLSPLDSIKAGLLGLAEANGRSDGDLASPRIDLKTMLDFFTRHAAYAAFRESDTGSIEVGKRADLIVLDRNLLTTSVEDLDQAKVLLTLLDGRPTYRDPAL